MLSASSQLIMRSEDTFVQGKWLLVNPTDSQIAEQLNNPELKYFINTMIFISKVVLLENQHNILLLRLTLMTKNSMVRLFTCPSLKIMQKC